MDKEIEQSESAVSQLILRGIMALVWVAYYAYRGIRTLTYVAIVVFVIGFGLLVLKALVVWLISNARTAGIALVGIAGITAALVVLGWISTQRGWTEVEVENDGPF